MFLDLITGAENLARLPPYQEIFASARGAAKNIFAVIDRVSLIDSMDNSGKILNSSEIKGNIEFKNVFFHYPSRVDVPVTYNLHALYLIFEFENEFRFRF